MWAATRYSVSFCFRNNPKETWARVAIATLMTLVMYFNVQCIGLIINAVQDALQKPDRSMEGLIWPITFFGLVQIMEIFSNRALIFYQGKWNQELRFANQQEYNDHRARLDIACFKSKRYDDLSKKIRELPMSWGTRVWFADQLFAIYALLMSFVLFGISLLWYRPIYALVLAVVAIPKLISEFGLVSMWWEMFEKHVPHHKKRDMLERPYMNVTAFTQAKMLNQMIPLRQTIVKNVTEVIDEYTIARRRVAQKKVLTNVILLVGLIGVVTHAVWWTIAMGGAIGTFSVIFTSARTFQGNLSSLIMTIADQWNSAKGVILIEKEFMGLTPLIQTPDPIVPKFVNPHIRFDRVSYIYDNTDKKVLEDVSFDIEPGSKVAIVGKSGNGKTTIASLLLRHYDPTEGAIYADDINLRNIEPSDWNNYASALTQDYIIQERLLGEEIASSRLDQAVNLTQVLTASDFAHFREVAEEDEQGFDKQIGSDFGGREFSGGEKQRLALARVRYRDTPIVLLDEPDARLDPESAEKVMDNIFALDGKTVIIITHHVSRAERCDKVIVMGKGRVVEQGNPKDLLAQNGVFARLCEWDRKRLGTLKAEA